MPPELGKLFENTRRFLKYILSIVHQQMEHRYLALLALNNLQPQEEHDIYRIASTSIFKWCVFSLPEFFH